MDELGIDRNIRRSRPFMRVGWDRERGYGSGGLLDKPADARFYDLPALPGPLDPPTRESADSGDRRYFPLNAGRINELFDRPVDRYGIVVRFYGVSGAGVRSVISREIPERKIPLSVG